VPASRTIGSLFELRFLRVTIETVNVSDHREEILGRHPFFSAGVHACLGEKELAFEWLEKAVREHGSFVMGLKVLPLLTLCTGIPGSTIW